MATPRPYEQRLRAEHAAQTRRRILDSVYAHLRRAPSEQVAVDRVARDAQVSRSTVYLIFGDRGGLFDAVGADLLDRGGFADVLAAVDNPDPRAALREFMRATVSMYAANRDVLRSLYSMAQLDPNAVGGAIARMESGRLQGMQLVAAGLAAAGQLRDDVTVDEATDVLWLLSGFDSFDLLHHGRGRAAESVAAPSPAASSTASCVPDPPLTSAKQNCTPLTFPALFRGAASRKLSYEPGGGNTCTGF